MRNYLAPSVATVFLCAASAYAQIPCDLVVDKGSGGTGIIEISIDSIFGTDTGSDSVEVGVTGSAGLLLSPNSEPFTDVTLTELDLNLSNGSVNYAFFCLPILGCQNLTLAFSNFNLNLLNNSTATIGPDGIVNFTGVEYIMSFTFNVSGSVFDLDSSYSSTPKEPSVSDFSMRLTPSDGNMLIDQLNLSPVVGDIPSEDLPTGIFQVDTLVTVQLDDVTMSGTYEAEPPSECAADFNGDSIVDGADFGSLLSAWGSCDCPEDLNSDGEVNGSDIGLILSVWGDC